MIDATKHICDILLDSEARHETALQVMVHVNSWLRNI